MELSPQRPAKEAAFAVNLARSFSDYRHQLEPVPSQLKTGPRLALDRDRNGHAAENCSHSAAAVC
jgi:hypothetical protein